METIMKNKNVLVTGASGFIGSHLTKELVKQGANVSILTLYDDKINNIRLSKIWDQLTRVEADIRNLDSLKVLKQEQFDVVYHLAAYNHVGDSFRHVSESFDVNGKGTANLLESCSNVKQFVYTSTSEIYGLQQSVPFREECNPQPLSPYAIGKYAGELYCRMKHEMNQFPVVVLRPFNTFGPFQTTKAVIPEMIINCLLNKEIKTTEGKQTREFNFVKNIVEGFILAGLKKNAVGKVINLGSATEISIKELVTNIHRLSGSKSQLKIGALPYRPTEIWRMFCDNKRAKEILEWEPRISFEEGLTKTIDWYRRYIEVVYKDNSPLASLSETSE